MPLGRGDGLLAAEGMKTLYGWRRDHAISCIEEPGILRLKPVSMICVAPELVPYKPNAKHKTDDGQETNVSTDELAPAPAGSGADRELQGPPDVDAM
jgi:hypothetical protein